MSAATPILPPVDEKAEEKVARELVAFPKAVGILTEAGLMAEDFYSPKRAVLYVAAQRVMQEGGSCNDISIWAAIEAMGEAYPKGSVDRLWVESLNEPAGVYYGVDELGRRIMERADRRRKLDGARKIIAAVDVDAEAEYIAGVQAGLEEITADHQADAQPSTPDEIAMYLHDFLEEGEPPVAWPLPWESLNRGLPGGLLPGQTSVWMGWTNMGKSAAVDQAMTKWSKEGAKCGLIATEMSLLERMARKIQMVSGISSLKFLTRQLSAEEKRTLAGLIQPENVPFHFHDAQGWTYQRIAQLITVKRYDVVAVDPLNLITGFADQETMTEAARSFQAVARRAGSHLVLVAHLNRKRSPQGMATKLPKPHHYDIRDSGMIANNADLVIGIHREQDEDGEVLPDGVVYIDKIRVGFKENERVSLDPKFLNFVRAKEEDYDEPADFFARNGAA